MPVVRARLDDRKGTYKSYKSYCIARYEALLVEAKPSQGLRMCSKG